jgi:diguanylate cyclase (GGDEF)-like protein/PAS domain S-box-containing protein
MTVRKPFSYSFNFLLMLSLLMAFAITFVFYLWVENQIDHHNHLRLQTFLLADELRQSSYDQTAMARAYVLTGDSIYQQYFHDILNIRDGKKSHPKNYNNSYWTLVLANKLTHQEAQGPGVALLELIRQTGITQPEMRALTIAKTNLDATIAVELTAMKMVEPTHTPNTTTNIEINNADAKATRDRASKILLDDQPKASIMLPLKEFYELVDARTKNTIIYAERSALYLRLLFIGLGLGIALMLWRINYILRTTLGGSVDKVRARIAQIGNDNLTTELAQYYKNQNNILGWLTEAHAKLNQMHRARQNAEAAVDAIDQRYQTLFNSARVGINIFHSDPEKCLIDSNPWLCQMLGYSLEEMRQLRPRDVVAPLEQENIEPAIASIAQKNDYFREWQLKRKDGSTFPAEIIAATMPDGSMMSMALDITERKLAETQLRNSQENLAITLQSIGDAVIATDAAGMITRMNLTAERLTGWSFNKSIGRPLTEVFNIINAQTRVPAIHPVQLVMEHGEVVGLANHTALIARDGREYQISDSAAPIRDASGNIVGVVLVFSDVTEKYKAEEALREKEWLLSESQRIAHIGSWSFDIQANRVTWSEETYRIYGVSPQTFEPTTESFKTLIHPEDLPVIEKISVAIRAGLPTKDEFRIITPAGDIRFISGHSEFLPASLAFPARMVGTAQDVTELKQAHERFRNTFMLIPSPVTLQTAQGLMLDCSNAFCEITGYSREEILGVDAQVLDLWVYPEQRDIMRDDLLRDGQIDNFEFQLRRRNGELRTMQLSARYLTPSSEPVLLSVAHDITERKQAEESLRQSEIRFKTIVEAEPECVKVVNDKGDLLEMNAAGLAMLEASSVEEVKTFSLTHFILPEYRADFIELHRRVMAGENAILAFEVIGLKGTRRWLETHATPMHNADTGEVDTLLGVTRDITLQKQAELALRESALHTQAILDNMLDGVLTINAQGLIQSFNKAASTIFGYTQEEVLGNNVSILMPEPHKSLHDGYMQHHPETGEGHVLGKLREVVGTRKDGTVFPMSISASKILRDGNAIFIGLIRDITQQRQDEEKINRLAFFDPLTNLPNRRLLFDRLTQAMLTSSRTDQHGALMFLDLDYFKQLNDNLGHDVGDMLLQQVALRIQSCVREGDSVARMGGDEFVLLIEALSLYANEAASQAELIAHKVLAALGQPYTLREHSYVITPSIGIVVFLHQTETMEELLKKADLAMYQAKGAGRNNARFFDPAMQAAVSVRADLEKSLRRAMEQKEFVLHYQLQVDGKGTPTGVEALVRWNHSRHGIISPAAFIPLAEETGVILPLGQWVLETACAQLVKWAKIPEMAHWTMAVNVSVLQFAQTDFVSSIDKAVQKTGANPRLLKLELTESMLAKDVDEVIIKMFEIKALGVTFSLDDFGTGYSSLSYLKRLPLDQLKIDQSFVRDLLTDPNDAVIARAIIALGHSLSLRVIAEGVETREQRDSLASMGCDAYQGYYFSRPVAARDMALAIDNLPSEKH